MEKKIRIAKVHRPFGIKGEIRISSESEFVEERFKIGRLLYFKNKYIEEGYTLESIRKHNRDYVIKLEELNSIEEVEILRHSEILIDYQELHALPEGQYYYVDLIGLNAYSNERYIGKIIDVMDTPAHPVLRIKGETRDILVPYVERFIESVSLEEGCVTINWMEGL